MIGRRRFLTAATSALVVPNCLGAKTVVPAFAPETAPIVIAHRSAVLGDAPENSLPWIQGAIARGVDAVHINAQQTADDRYVLMHDPTLNRTTNVEQAFPNGPPNGPTRDQRGGRDYVRDYTLADIKRLRLTGAATGLTVPMLEDAVQTAQGKILVLLGLKNHEAESLASALQSADRDNLLLHQLYFSGTNQSALRDLAARTGLGVAVSLFRSQDYLKDLNAISEQLGPALKLVTCGSARLTPDFMARAKELAVHPAISGWNGPEDRALANDAGTAAWRDLLDLGFSAFTDRPDEVLAILGR